MADAHQATLKVLIHFLEEAVTCTCNTREWLSCSCGEVNHLLHNWKPSRQGFKFDTNAHQECSNQYNGSNGVQRVKETSSSSSKTSSKIRSVVSGSSASLKAPQEETTDKRKASVHSHSKEFATSTAKSKLSLKGMQERDKVIVNVMSSTSESKDPARKKMLVTFKQNPLIARTTYQSDYSTLKPTTYTKRAQNVNSINSTARNSQAKKNMSGSLKSDRTRRVMNETHGTKQMESGKFREWCAVDNKLKNDKVKPMCLTLEEAVDTFKICTTTSELVRNFRLHYSFLHNIEEKKDHPAAAQNGAASGAFLKLFSELNKASWHKNLSEPLGRLFADTMSLSRNVFNVDSCISRTDLLEKLELKNIYQRMEKQFLRLSNQDNIVHTVNRTRSTPRMTKHTTPCQNMGMWYWRQTAISYGLQSKLYLVYKDEKQWQKLQKNLQLLERLKFQIDVFDLILSEIIPQILTMDPNSKNFQMMLKVVWALTDFTRLPTPIFIIP